MASEKITVTVPRQQLEDVRRLVASGQAASVSGFVQQAIRLALDDAAGWEHTLDQALDATGGPLTDAERAWADEVLHATTRDVA